METRKRKCDSTPEIPSPKRHKPTNDIPNITLPIEIWVMILDSIKTMDKLLVISMISHVSKFLRGIALDMLESLYDERDAVCESMETIDEQRKTIGIQLRKLKLRYNLRTHKGIALLEKSMALRKEYEKLEDKFKPLKTLNIPAIAARFGYLNCLVYTTECVIEKHGGLSFDEEETCYDAAYFGQLECLKYAHEKGYNWSNDVCDLAAGSGVLECLKYAHENGAKWGPKTCSIAAEEGHFECLKYAHENGGMWNEDICQYAVSGGNLKCLKYVIDDGCKNTKDICEFSAIHGQLEILKYAHKNGYVWNEETCVKAVLHGNLECLKYARENGCPYGETICDIAAKIGSLKALQYRIVVR